MNADQSGRDGHSAAVASRQPLCGVALIWSDAAHTHERLALVTANWHSDVEGGDGGGGEGGGGEGGGEGGGGAGGGGEGGGGKAGGDEGGASSQASCRYPVLRRQEPSLPPQRTTQRWPLSVHVTLIPGL